MELLNDELLLKLDVVSLEQKLSALCMLSKCSKEELIKTAIITSISYETMPNYKNYKYLISGITQARMIKGVNRKTGKIESQIAKLLETYDVEEINKDILETSINLIITTFDSIFKNSSQKTKNNFLKALDDIDFLYINLKLAVKIVAETLRSKNQELSNMTLQYITDSIKMEKKNIALTYIEAYSSGNEEEIINARNNYRKKMEIMLNNYYKTIKYNHEHAVKIGMETLIVETIGKDIIDLIVSNLLFNMQSKIKENNFLQLTLIKSDKII